MKLPLFTCLAIVAATLPALASDDTKKEDAATEAAAASETSGEAMEIVADAAHGSELYEESCRSCHGPTAKGMASFPKLVGHDAEYLTMRLEQYRAGEKVGPNTALMAPNAADLTDQDIADIVAHIVSLE